ncbi:MAG TPA: hypothetical protein VF066_06115 [Thermoleophilaceae bacterium]
MRTHARMRAAAMGVATAVGALALLGGPAASLALDRVPSAEPVVTASGSEPPAPVSATVQGSNPHGQGTVLAVSVGGKEAVVVGRSRGEQRPDGTYHGHTTTLGLLGNDVIGNDTGPGETAKGPLAPMQEQVLDQICTGSGGNVCADVLRADSATTSSGSHNHTRVAGLVLGGEDGASVTVADSNGDVQGDGDCQRAHGDVTLIKLMLGGNPLLDIGESASDSKSCPAGTTVTNSSNPLVAIGGQQVPLPGCGANEPGNLVDLSPLLTIACNAGAGTGSGGIVNDALAGTVLPGANGPVGTVSGGGTGAAAHAASQGVLGVRQTSPSKTGAASGTGATDRGNGTGRDKSKTGTRDGAKTPNSAMLQRPLTEGADKLPYTGGDVVLALFVASCLLTLGLGLRRLAARSE